MASFLFRCPQTRLLTQAWADDEDGENDDYVMIVCDACNRTHLVKPSTGKVLGNEDQ